MGSGQLCGVHRCKLRMCRSILFQRMDMGLPSSAAHFFSMANILMAFVLLLHMNKCRIHVVYVELSVSLLVY